MNDERNSVKSKEPWWKDPPTDGRSEMDLEWGYLIVYEDGSVEFTLDEKPSMEEIRNRRSCRL